MSMLTGALVVGCGDGDVTGPSQPDDGELGFYSVTLSVDSRAALPACTKALTGTVAHVSTPSELLTCQGARWYELPCTNLLAGAVAYASASKDLWACVSGGWVAVALPSGSVGPAGPSGSAGPQGAPGASSLIRTASEPAGLNCALGGTSVSVGSDENGNGELDATEVEQVAYVCNGVAAVEPPVPPQCTLDEVRCAGNMLQACTSKRAWVDSQQCRSCFDGACVDEDPTRSLSILQPLAHQVLRASDDADPAPGYQVRVASALSGDPCRDVQYFLESGCDSEWHGCEPRILVWWEAAPASGEVSALVTLNVESLESYYRIVARANYTFTDILSSTSSSVDFALALE